MQTHQIHTNHQIPIENAGPNEEEEAAVGQQQRRRGERRESILLRERERGEKAI